MRLENVTVSQLSRNLNHPLIDPKSKSSDSSVRFARTSGFSAVSNTVENGTLSFLCDELMCGSCAKATG